MGDEKRPERPEICISIDVERDYRLDRRVTVRGIAEGLPVYLDALHSLEIPHDLFVSGEVVAELGLRPWDRMASLMNPELGRISIERPDRSLNTNFRRRPNTFVRGLGAHHLISAHQILALAHKPSRFSSG